MSKRITSQFFIALLCLLPILGMAQNQPNIQLNPEVVQSQLIIQYDGLTFEQIKTLEERLRELGGVEIDRCNCERSIAIWQFGSPAAAAAAAEEDVDVDGTSKPIKTVADVDGNEFIEVAPRGLSKGFELQFEQLPSLKKSILVYLIDSGLTTKHLPNRDNLMSNAPNYACSRVKSAGYNYAYPPRIHGNFNDKNGHGTFGYRAITRGLSKNIKVVPLKVFNKDGEGTLFGLICAMYHAIDNGADIVNVSAGYQGKDNEILRKAVEEANTANIFIVAAAGNDKKNIDKAPQYPAVYARDFPNVISVASIDLQNGQLGNCSNYGKKTVTMSAPGERICGYNHKGEKVIQSGTSMATFYVTRHLAVWLSNKATPISNAESARNAFLGEQDGGCLNTKTSSGTCLKVSSSECRVSPFKVFALPFN